MDFAAIILQSPNQREPRVDAGANIFLWMGIEADLRTARCSRIVKETNGKTGREDEGHTS